MSYTAPAGDAINFSWVGKSAYTRPNGDAINFSWVDGGGGSEPVTSFKVIELIKFIKVTQSSKQ